jgi:hypothetical protein
MRGDGNDEKIRVDFAFKNLLKRGFMLILMP